MCSWWPAHWAGCRPRRALDRHNWSRRLLLQAPQKEEWAPLPRTSQVSCAKPRFAAHFASQLGY